MISTSLPTPDPTPPPSLPVPQHTQVCRPPFVACIVKADSQVGLSAPVLAWLWAAPPSSTPESWAGTGVQEMHGALARGGPVSPEGGPQTSTLLLALPF